MSSYNRKHSVSRFRAVFSQGRQHFLFCYNKTRPMERIPTRQERFTAHAETLRAKFATGILKSMQQKPLWSLYRLEKDQQGNLHKRPYHPRGYPASIYKPRSWSSLDAVLEALATGTFSGIGIFLPDPYALIDVDTKEDAPVYDREKKNIVSPFVLRLL